MALLALPRSEANHITPRLIEKPVGVREPVAVGRVVLHPPGPDRAIGSRASRLCHDNVLRFVDSIPPREGDLTAERTPRGMVQDALCIRIDSSLVAGQVNLSGDGALV